MPAYAGRDPHAHAALLAAGDVFAEEQQAKQDALDALVDSLAPPPQLRADVEALQSFLAGDAAQTDKIDQLVNFLAAGAGAAPERHVEPEADTDVFADEQEQKQKALEDLVDSLANNNTSATALLATSADDVDSVGAQTSFLNVVGGAVLLLVAVVLVVVAKRSSRKREAEDENKDFGYSILYE
ncbi:unnamed protein product [Phytophthora lilii]|uniref:Unnamed protein product n=1 Tax=Phytophthora lilii TaxID=2077276 RepID=A0A9W7CRJ6_9STRA|nr:unnamed protein product [Phytophthora lilii]